MLGAFAASLVLLLTTSKDVVTVTVNQPPGTDLTAFAVEVILSRAAFERVVAVAADQGIPAGLTLDLGKGNIRVKLHVIIAVTCLDMDCLHVARGKRRIAGVITHHQLPIGYEEANIISAIGAGDFQGPVRL